MSQALRRWSRRLLIVLAGMIATVVVGFAAVIAFDAPAALPRLAAGDSLPGADKWDWKALPPVSKVTARDGAPLTYRRYAGAGNRAVVLVHGSSGSGISMHRLALELQAAGATVYAISLRGHGGSGRVVGDISYKDQLDDDLVDFVKAVGVDKPGIHRTLIGFSSGGGFVLRTASGSDAALFDAYLPISPYIGQGSPTVRPAAGGWVSVAMPRAIALGVLDGLGLPWFQDLTIIRFATDAAPSENRTPTYSWRLQSGMHLHRNWREEIARVTRPTIVAVGAKDELFRGDQFAPLFASLNPAIRVSVLPDAGHLTMISDDQAVATVAGLWRRLANTGRFDAKVREDMFAGFDGDKEALERAMKLIAEALARDPDHAQALAWRGSGRVFLAGQAFQRGAYADGATLANQGLADLDRAVALEPDFSTRAARGPVLLAYADGLRRFDKTQADRLTQTAIGDFDYMLQASAADWAKLAEHDRGELLGGLATGWLQLGDAAKASPFLDRMISELPGTLYARNATVRRGDPASRTPLNCLGCH